MSIQGLKKTVLLPANQDGVQEAIERLTKGQLVALPTETVYGLAARADSPAAVNAIFQAKKRPASHPLIVHVGRIEQLCEWAKQVPDIVFELAEAFCPGPITFILPLLETRDRTVTGGQSWVGLRIPSHSLTTPLLAESGLAIAAPSANRFGRISPTSSSHVLEELEGEIDAVLEGGNCQIGIESTIIKVDQEHISLLRPGHIKPEQIEAIARRPITIVHKTSDNLRVSGQLDSHYAPVKPAYRIPAAHIAEYLEHWNSKDWIVLPSDQLHWSAALKEKEICFHVLENYPALYAQNFYAALREGDSYSSSSRLWIIEPEATQEWRALRDRIYRATCIPESILNPE